MIRTLPYLLFVPMLSVFCMGCNGRAREQAGGTAKKWATPEEAKNAARLIRSWVNARADDREAILQELRHGLHHAEAPVRLVYAEQVGLTVELARTVLPDLLSVLKQVDKNDDNQFDTVCRSIVVTGTAAMPYLQKMAGESSVESRLVALRCASAIGLSGDTEALRAQAAAFVKKMTADKARPVASMAKDKLEMLEFVGEHTKPSPSKN